MYPLIRHTLRKRLRSLPAWQQEDALANGLCFAWPAFQWAWKRHHATKPPVDIARIAAWAAAKKAISGREYCSTRQGGYVDALDHRFRKADVDLDLYPAPMSARTAPWDTQDMGKVCPVIGKMPEHLRGVAFCLAANDEMRALVRSTLPDSVRRASGELTRREIAAYIDSSDDTVYRRIAEIATWFAGDGHDCLLAIDGE